jgi:hypothetical protein
VARCRTIVSHVAPESFEYGVSCALGTLGYDIVPAGEERTPAELRIVDEESLERFDWDASRSVPIVVLTEDHAPQRLDRRVIDALRRPAPFRDVYMMLQRALESTPRSNPRITTARPARCEYGEETCVGAVVELSEGGCLFRGHPGFLGGPEIRVLFSLPSYERLELRARTAHRSEGDLGLAFLGLGPGARSAISDYVMNELLAN